VKDGQRALAARDVDLVPRPTVERTAGVRADLGFDPEATEQPERPSRDRGLGQVEVDGELAVPE
jgi:hypothetical protein